MKDKMAAYTLDIETTGSPLHSEAIPDGSLSSTIEAAKEYLIAKIELHASCETDNFDFDRICIRIRNIVSKSELQAKFRQGFAQGNLKVKLR